MDTTNNEQQQQQINGINKKNIEKNQSENWLHFISIFFRFGWESEKEHDQCGKK